MNIPNDLRYTKEHEWVRLEGDVASWNYRLRARRTR